MTTIERFGEKLDEIKKRFEGMSAKKLKNWLSIRFANMDEKPSGRFDVGCRVDLALDELEDRLCRQGKRGEYREFARGLFA